MYLVDFHTHTHVSPDGCQSAFQMCESALGAGLSEIALTDHCECNGWNGGPFLYDQSLAREEAARAAETFAGRLKVAYGVELGQITQNTALGKQILREGNYDFVIGSLHNNSGMDDFCFLDYNVVDFESEFRRYLEELYATARMGEYDVLGHVTYPLRYYCGNWGRSFDLAPYYADFLEIFRTVAGMGKGIEVNTSGLRQKLGKTMPDLDLLKLFHQAGGQVVTVGSDAHGLKDVGNGITRGLELIKAAGFSYYAVYSSRVPRMVPID